MLTSQIIIENIIAGFENGLTTRQIYLLRQSLLILVKLAQSEKLDELRRDVNLCVPLSKFTQEKKNSIKAGEIPKS